MFRDNVILLFKYYLVISCFEKNLLYEVNACSSSSRFSIKFSVILHEITDVSNVYTHLVQTCTKVQENNAHSFIKFKKSMSSTLSKVNAV